MPELSEVVTIRQLPDGDARRARIAKPDIGRLDVFTLEEDSLHAGASPVQALAAGDLIEGALVEIEGSQAIYLGEVVSRQGGTPGAARERFTVAVDHFIDRAALAEIDTAWKTIAGV